MEEEEGEEEESCASMDLRLFPSQTTRCWLDRADRRSILQAVLHNWGTLLFLVVSLEEILMVARAGFHKITTLGIAGSQICPEVGEAQMELDIIALQLWAGMEATDYGVISIAQVATMAAAVVVIPGKVPVHYMRQVVSAVVEMVET
jgi:hypothetical protein